MSETYKVIGNLKSRAVRVLWALEEMGLDYELQDAAPHSAEVFRHNNSGKIPILVTQDGEITDSLAILTYLADRHGKLTYPAGTMERAHQDSLTFLILDELEGALWTFSKAKFALPREHRVEGIKVTAEWEFHRGLQHLEPRLAPEGFALGPQMTITDILLGHCGLWAKGMGWEIPEGTRTAALIGDLLARPALARVRQTG